MKSLFLALLFPVVAFGQRTESFGKFTGPEGTAIRGTSVARGFERQLEIKNIVGTAAGNNTTISFEIPNSEAAAAFRNIVNTKQRLRSGEIQVMQLGEKRVLDYKIVMQDIAVEECVDAEGVSKLKVTAGRIGWIYYTTDRRGKAMISSKSGWDAAAQNVWTEF